MRYAIFALFIKGELSYFHVLLSNTYMPMLMPLP